MRTLRIIFLNIGLSVLVIALVLLLLKIDRLRLSPLPAFMEMVAWPFFVMGTILIVSAVYTLFKHSSATGAPGDPTRKLVSEGLYKWMRNPIYAGDILLLFGLAFFTKSWLLFVIALGSIPVLHFVVCFIEEPRAEKRLGKDYQFYKQRVPRWIPRLTGRSKKQIE